MNENNYSDFIVSIPLLDKEEDFDFSCLKCSIDNYQWENKTKPLTIANLAIVPSGLKVKFVVNESHPLALKTEHLQKVCEDSACELFIAFPTEFSQSTFTAHNEQHIYVNFEINSNGCCYAKYGARRAMRTFLSLDDIKNLHIKTEIKEHSWTLEYTIPHGLIKKICGFNALEEGSCFNFNLYKISETKDVQHFVSYSKICSDTPNFHKLDDFARAKVVRG